MAGIKINDASLQVASVTGSNLIPTVDPTEPSVPKVCTVDNMFSEIFDMVGLDSIPAFSTETAYSIGQLVRYNDKMYRFITAKTAGTWDSTKVVETDVYSELAAMRSSDYETVSVTVTQGGVATSGIVVSCAALTTTSATTDANGLAVFTVNKGVLYTLSISSQPSGYYGISPKTYVASYATRSVGFNFVPTNESVAEEEEVSVLLIAGNTYSESNPFTASEGSTVKYTVDGTTYTETVDSNGTCTFNVTMGKTYTIEFPKIDNYAKPDDRTYTALFAERTVVVQCPLYVGEDDITILCEDGVEYGIDEYEALEEQPDGVAVHVQTPALLATDSDMDDGKMCDFYIPVDWVSASKAYLSSNVTITNVTTTTTNNTSNSASIHYKYTGTKDTDRLRVFLENNSSYTSAAYSYIEGLGTKSWLVGSETKTFSPFIPAFGQLWIIKTGLTTINEALTLIGGSTLAITSGNWWSCTQCDAAYMWRLSSGSASSYGTSKTGSCTVLPLYA